MVRQNRAGAAAPVRAHADTIDRAMPIANQGRKRGSQMPSSGR